MRRRSALRRWARRLHALAARAWTAHCRRWANVPPRLDLWS
ncbi:hypothetical protein [Nonomuraea dietziae]